MRGVIVMNLSCSTIRHPGERRDPEAASQYETTSELDSGVRRNDDLGLSLDLREISHGKGRLANLIEQLQAVFSERRIIGIDRDVVEECIDG
jgi:hypothetical protein